MTRPRPPRPLGVYALVRLSREDMRGPGTTEQKLADQAQVCRDLARNHKLPLAEDAILYERETSGKSSLSKRPEMARMLEMARAGTLTHLIVRDQERLTRNKREWPIVEEALCRERIILVTCHGIVDFGDPDYELKFGLLVGMRVQFSSAYVAYTVNARRQMDEIRLKRNVRSRGFAPYGYLLLKPPRDPIGNPVLPTNDDIERGFAYRETETQGLRWHTHIPDPETYPTLLEILRRVLYLTPTRLARELTQEGIPTPNSHRPGFESGTVWFRGTVIEILKNPFYAGRLAQRRKVENGKSRVLPTEEYVIAPSDGDWEHPLSLDEWHALQEKHFAPPVKGTPKGRSGLLTGLLFCPEGRAMRIGHGHAYGCSCYDNHESHKGMAILIRRIEFYAQSVVTAVFDALPIDFLGMEPKKARTRASVLAALGQARRDLVEKETAVYDLMRNELRYSEMFGEENYMRSAERARTELEQAQERYRGLDLEAQEPDVQEIKTVVERVRALGMEDFWCSSTRDEQRGVIERFIARIDLLPIPDSRRAFTEARVTLCKPFEPFAHVIPSFPRCRSGQPPGTKRPRDSHGRYITE